jgi:hypothetical protein
MLSDMSYIYIVQLCVYETNYITKIYKNLLILLSMEPWAVVKKTLS